jgi:hypothetical protein
MSLTRQLLPTADINIVMDEGKVYYCGPYNRRAVIHAFPTAAIAEDEMFHKGDAELSREKLVRRTSSIKPSDAEKLKKERVKIAADEEKKHNNRSSARSYKLWFEEIGFCLAFISLLIHMFTQINRIMSDWFIGRWTANSFGLPVMTYFGIYCGLVGLFCINLFIRGTFFYRLSLRASSSMHNVLFRVPLFSFIFDLNRGS